MSLLTDIRNVSDTVIEQLSGQFHDLPHPLLAAIGAGDLAVERLAKLREQLGENISAGGGAPSGEDVKAFAADLPSRAQRIAGEVAHNLEEFATSAPEKVQRLIGELPAKASELTDSLSPEHIRGTVEGYTQMVAMIYDNLVERGGKAAEKVRGQARQDGTVRAAGTPAASTASQAPAARRVTRKPAATTASTAKAGTSRAGTSRAGTTKAASTTRKTASAGKATRKPAAPRT